MASGQEKDMNAEFVKDMDRLVVRSDGHDLAKLIHNNTGPHPIGSNLSKTYQTFVKDVFVKEVMNKREPYYVNYPNKMQVESLLIAYYSSGEAAKKFFLERADVIDWAKWRVLKQFCEKLNPSEIPFAWPPEKRQFAHEKIKKNSAYLSGTHDTAYDRYLQEKGLAQSPALKVHLECDRIRKVAKKIKDQQAKRASQSVSSQSARPTKKSKAASSAYSSYPAAVSDDDDEEEDREEEEEEDDEEDEEYEKTPHTVLNQGILMLAFSQKYGHFFVMPTEDDVSSFQKVCPRSCTFAEIVQHMFPKDSIEKSDIVKNGLFKRVFDSAASHLVAKPMGLESNWKEFSKYWTSYILVCERVNTAIKAINDVMEANPPDIPALVTVRKHLLKFQKVINSQRSDEAKAMIDKILQVKDLKETETRIKNELMTEELTLAQMQDYDDQITQIKIKHPEMFEDMDDIWAIQYYQNHKEKMGTEKMTSDEEQELADFFIAKEVVTQEKMDEDMQNCHDLKEKAKSMFKDPATLIDYEKEQPEKLKNEFFDANLGHVWDALFFERYQMFRATADAFRAMEKRNANDKRAEAAAEEEAGEGGEGHEEDEEGEEEVEKDEAAVQPKGKAKRGDKPAQASSSKEGRPARQSKPRDLFRP